MNHPFISSSALKRSHRNLQICCPKACVSTDDIYANGQCYPRARLGEECSISEQCIAAEGPSSEALKCVQGICTCPLGHHAIEGVCKSWFPFFSRAIRLSDFIVHVKYCFLRTLSSPLSYDLFLTSSFMNRFNISRSLQHYFCLRSSF